MQKLARRKENRKFSRNREFLIKRPKINKIKRSKVKYGAMRECRRVSLAGRQISGESLRGQEEPNVHSRYKRR